MINHCFICELQKQRTIGKIRIMSEMVCLIITTLNKTSIVIGYFLVTCPWSNTNESNQSIPLHLKKKIKEYLELTKNKMAFVTAKSNVRSKIIWHFFKRLLYASNDCVCAKIWRSCMSPSLDPFCLPTLHEWHWELFTIRFSLDGGDSSSICQVAFWINVFQCILKKGII